MTAPKRRAVPPFEVGRDVHGFADRITRGGWTLLRLVEGATVNEEHVESIVARLNAAPLDWPSRYNGRKRRVSTAAPAKGPLEERCDFCGAAAGGKCWRRERGPNGEWFLSKRFHAARVRAARLRQEEGR